MRGDRSYEGKKAGSRGLSPREVPDGGTEAVGKARSREEDTAALSPWEPRVHRTVTGRTHGHNQGRASRAPAPGARPRWVSVKARGGSA